MASFTSIHPRLIEVDLLLARGELTEAVELLTAYYQEPADIQPLQIAWRLAQSHIYIADHLMYQGISDDRVEAAFDTAQEWLDVAMEIDDSQHFAYFWQAALIGQRGIYNGPLNSLATSGQMRDLLIKSAQMEPTAGYIYYTASFLYELLPRFFSFGDRDAAVSLARTGIMYHLKMVEDGLVVHDFQDNRLQLARALWHRDWDQEKRRAEQAVKRDMLKQVADPFERAKLMEGIMEIPEMSDRQEALVILDQVQARLDYPDRLYADERDWEKLMQLRAAWQD
ncbi:MAG: hypothetical protein D6B26_07665 [Spirochaetaceae bacterium]|nr:MAG: hypothetical protein D6B26_07665 [Spirochaetaceae bacterium]